MKFLGLYSDNIDIVNTDDKNIKNTMNVPKIIHRIWFDFDKCKKNKTNSSNIDRKEQTHLKQKHLKNLGCIDNLEIPERLRKDFNECHALHSDWKIMYWNETEADIFVKNTFNDILWTIYEHLEFPVQKVDMLKYMLLYIYGGIVLDIDICCLKKLDYFDAEHTVYLPPTHPNLLPSPTTDNFILASCPKYPYWEDVFKEIIKRQDKHRLITANPFMWGADRELHTILYETGPGVLHYIYHKQKSIYNLILLDRELFNPKHPCLGFVFPLNQSYLVHNAERMWMREDCHIEEIYFACQQNLILVLFAIAIIAFIVGFVRI
jgi:mannosyltransferase OCH1-like enzyme